MRLFYRDGAMLLAVAILTALGCSRESGPAGSGEVVVYTSIDDVFARPICEKFQRETGIKVQLVPDTEETKSTGLLNRLIAEKARPRCDVFWSGDPIRAAILKSKGISAPYTSPQAAELPKLYSDPDGHWTGFSCRARVIIYNRTLVPQGQEPKSVRDLLDERFRGKACMANPLFGTTSMHAAALFAKLGDDEAQKFFAGFSANGGKVLSSNSEVRRRIAAGEFTVGLTDTDDYNVARQEGKPVGVVYPDADGMGTVIVPNVSVRRIAFLARMVAWESWHGVGFPRSLDDGCILWWAGGGRTGTATQLRQGTVLAQARRAAGDGRNLGAGLLPPARAEGAVLPCLAPRTGQARSSAIGRPRSDRDPTRRRRRELACPRDRAAAASCWLRASRCVAGGDASRNGHRDRVAPRGASPRAGRRRPKSPARSAGRLGLQRPEQLRRGDAAMLSISGQVKIFLSLAPTDMRKSIDGAGKPGKQRRPCRRGLCGLASNVLAQDPSSGHLFAFVSRRRDRVKLLYFDVDGYVLWYKRLEVGVFRMPRVEAGQVSLALSAADLSLLLAGIDLQSVQRTRRYRRPAVATARTDAVADGGLAAAP